RHRVVPYLTLELGGAGADADFQIGACTFERICRLTLRREVPRDFCEAHPAGAEAPHHAAAEATDAVLADVIALAGRPAEAAGPGDLFPRRAGNAVFRREQDLDIRSDDLVGGVAEHALGAGVPRIDSALLGDGEDRIVEGAVDQQPQPLLALAD